MPVSSVSSSPLPQKLQLRPDSILILRNAPRRAREALASLPVGARLAESGESDCDAALVFVSREAQVGAELEEIVPRLAGDDPVLWFAYPKAGQLETDLTRDAGWEAVTEAGWKPVRQVAIDDVWSALRFRRD